MTLARESGYFISIRPDRPQRPMMSPYDKPQHDDPFGPPREQYAGDEPTRTNGLAIASLVCGLLFCLAIPSVLAIVFGTLGIRQTRDRRIGGKGMAVAGLVLGIVGTAGWALVGGGGYFLGKWVMTEMKQVQEVSDTFMLELSDGKVDAAAARITDDVPHATLEATSRAMKDWGRFGELRAEIRPIQVPDDARLHWTIQGDAVFSKTRKPVTMRLVKSGDKYLVEQFTCP